MLYPSALLWGAGCLSRLGINSRVVLKNVIFVFFSYVTGHLALLGSTVNWLYFVHRPKETLLNEPTRTTTAIAEAGSRETRNHGSTLTESRHQRGLPPGE